MSNFLHYIFHDSHRDRDRDKTVDDTLCVQLSDRRVGHLFSKYDFPISLWLVVDLPQDDN